MSYFSWLRNWKRAAPAARRPLQMSFRRRTGFRPRLEALEDRSLPSTLTVTTYLDGSPGSLRAEIAAANAGDTIVFASPLVSVTSTSTKVHGKTTTTTTTTTSNTITLTIGELLISKNLNIQGPAPGQAPITVSGGTLVDQYGNPVAGYRVFEVGANAVVTLSGLVISNGYAIYDPYYTSRDGLGGGIKNMGTLTVSDCELTRNFAHWDGGGIYNTGTLTVSGCELCGNDAADGDGGGIYNDYQGTLTVSDSALLQNFASAGYEIDPNARGGGIFNLGTATVSDCQFSGNSANYGDGIYNFGPAAALTVTGSTFKNGPDNISGLYTDGGGNSFS
jgi:hypothetical protein